MNDEIFDYSDMGEAWSDFTKSARAYFARLVKKRTLGDDPEMIDKVAGLTYKDYCARLMYIISFMPDENDVYAGVDFDIDWAMILAKPTSVNTAKMSLKQLIHIGMITEIEEDSDIKTLPPKNNMNDGGSTNINTRFDFD